MSAVFFIALIDALKTHCRGVDHFNALRIPLTTLDVFAHTMDEIFQMEYQYGRAPFKNPCYFGMSINDDILDYDLTEQIVRQHFQKITIQKFTHPYHQLCSGLLE